MAKETVCPAHSGMSNAVATLVTVMTLAILGVAGMLWKVNEGVAEIRGATTQIIGQLQDVKTDAKTTAEQAKRHAQEAQSAAAEARAAADKANRRVIQ